MVRLNFSHGEHARPPRRSCAGRPRHRASARAARSPSCRTSRAPRSAPGRVKDNGGRAPRRGAARHHHRRDHRGHERADLHHLRPPAPGRRAGRPHPARRRQPRAPGRRAPRASASLTEVVHGGLLKSQQGHEPARGEALHPRPHREGPARPRLRRRSTGVDYVALSFVRQAAGRRGDARPSSSPWAARMPVIAKIEKREAIDDLPADPGGRRRGDGGARRPRGGALDRRGPDPPEAHHRDGQRGGQGGHHRHPDAREHDRERAAHARRGLRRGQRDPRRHRRHHALGGDRLRPLPRGVGRDHVAHRRLHRGALRLPQPRPGGGRGVLDGGAQPGPGGRHRGRGARLQADRGLHGVGRHGAARLVLSAARPHRRHHLQRRDLPPAQPLVGRRARDVGLRRRPPTR